MNAVNRAVLFTCVVVALLAFLTLLAFSCESVPPILSISDWCAVLPGDESLYVSVGDCAGFGSIFNTIFGKYGLAPDQLSDLMRRTDRVLFSSGKELTGLLLGRYLPLSMSPAFSGAGEWTRVDGLHPYWKHTSAALSVAQPRGYLLLAAAGDIVDDIERVDTRNGCRLPDDVTPFMEKSAVACYVPRFGDRLLPIDVPFNREKVPLADVLASIDRSTDGYAIDAHFGIVQQGDNRRIFITSLKTFVIWLARSAGVANFVNRIVISEDERGVAFGFSPCTKEEVEKMIDVLINAGNRQ